MAVASAGQYANHLQHTPYRQPSQHFLIVASLLVPRQQCRNTEDNRMLICWFVNTSFKPQWQVSWIFLNKLLLFIHSLQQRVNQNQQSTVTSSSAVADKPIRRAASQLTAKF